MTAKYSRNPEVVTSRSPDFVAIANHVRDESWTKVTSEVDGISGFPAEASTDSKDDEEEAEWSEWASANVSVVLKRVDQEHKEGAGDELGEELARLGHEFGGVGAENAGCSGLAVAWDCSNAGATLEDVDG